MVENAANTTGLSLSGFLNILWRRRLLILLFTALGGTAGIVYGLVVSPLYRASTTIQPGVTHYDIEGRPERQWRIRDVVQWYKRGDFNPGVARVMGEDDTRFLPIIRASFLPRGPQSRGGNTITLITLHPDPEKARRILDASVQVFLEFAGSDTLYSDVHLQRVQTSSNVAREEALLRQTEGKIERVELAIEAAKLDKTAIEASVVLLRGRIREREAVRELVMATLAAYQNMIATAEAGVADMEADLARWAEASDALIARRDSLIERSSDALALALYTNSVNGLVSEINTLRLGMFDQADRRLEWQNSVKQLSVDLGKAESELAGLSFEQEQTLPSKIFAAQQKIVDLELQRDFDIAQEQEGLIQDIRGTKARLAALSPLEQIGEPVATSRPVRPRKMRAFLILLGLGFASSIFLTVGLEYLSRNWREIARPGTGV